MRTFRKTMLALIGVITGGLSAVSVPQNATSPPASPPSNLRSMTAFGFDDLMTLLIQPRHIKLYYAGEQKNWELAAAESRELRAAFLRVTLAYPRYANNDVDEAIATIMTPQMNAIDAAISAANLKQFEAAYGEITAACNACHSYMEHPFLIIKTPPPWALSYPDQEFSVPR